MTDEFRPFAGTRVPPRTSGQPVRVAILPRTMRPLGAPVATAPPPPPSPADTALVPPPAAECEPQLTLERDGDRITRITVRCSCGKILDLVCTS